MAVGVRQTTQVGFSLLLGGALLLCVVSCVVPTSLPVSATDCFLANTTESFFSEILQGRQRVVMAFELIDGVAPRAAAVVAGLPGHWIPSGPHRVQFRVYLPPVGWNDGRGREARAIVDLDLRPGGRYKVTGDFQKGIRAFYVADVTSGEAVTPPIDVGFFAPVEGPKGFIPILIPVRK